MVAEAQYWFCCGGLGSIRSTGSEEGRVGTEGAGREREVVMPPSQMEINKGEIKAEASLLLGGPCGGHGAPAFRKAGGFSFVVHVMFCFPAHVDSFTSC